MDVEMLDALFRMLPKPRQAVFILGCGHTGTTLLERILAAHPQIFSVRYETNAFVDVKFLNAVSGTLLFLRAALSGRPVLVEKTPRHVLHTKRILTLIPSTKFVVVTRDGRDVVNSLGKRYRDYDRALKRWIADTSASVDLLDNKGAYWWKYEDLIDNPEASLKNLCEFIGIKFEPEILQYYETPVRWGRPGRGSIEHTRLRNQQVNRPISDTRGKWKTELPAGIVEAMKEGRAAELMLRLEYY